MKYFDEQATNGLLLDSRNQALVGDTSNTSGSTVDFNANLLQNIVIMLIKE